MITGIKDEAKSKIVSNFNLMIGLQEYFLLRDFRTIERWLDGDYMCRKFSEIRALQLIEHHTGLTFSQIFIEKDFEDEAKIA